MIQRLTGEELIQLVPRIPANAWRDIEVSAEPQRWLRAPPAAHNLQRDPGILLTILDQTTAPVWYERERWSVSQ